MKLLFYGFLATFVFVIMPLSLRQFWRARLPPKPVDPNDRPKTGDPYR